MAAWSGLRLVSCTKFIYFFIYFIDLYFLFSPLVRDPTKPSSQVIYTPSSHLLSFLPLKVSLLFYLTLGACSFPCCRSQRLKCRLWFALPSFSSSFFLSFFLSFSFLLAIIIFIIFIVAGGKWTTYRAMASDAVDKAITAFDLKPERACQTETSLLVGAHHYRFPLVSSSFLPFFPPFLFLFNLSSSFFQYFGLHQIGTTIRF